MLQFEKSKSKDYIDLEAYQMREFFHRIKNDQSATKIWKVLPNGCSIGTIQYSEENVSILESLLQSFSEQYGEVIDYGRTFVNCDYIGNSLQYQMLLEANKFALSNGYKFALSTVHPDNFYSINNLLKNNFEYKGEKTLKRGIRNVYLKKLD